MQNNELTPEIAEALLDYISMEDCRAKKNITILAKTEIQRYLKQADNYAKSQNISQEEALLKIIEN